jgi:acylphosphatase
MKIYCYVIVLVFLVSCNRSETVIKSNVSELSPSVKVLPENGFNPFLEPGENETQNAILLGNEFLLNKNRGLLLNKLSESLNLFNQSREKLYFEKSLDLWGKVKIGEGEFTAFETFEWVAVNAELLQISGNVKFAVELEKILYSLPRLSDLDDHGKKILDKISQVVFTKNVDHIYLNMFISSQVKFKHSLGGDVGIQQNVDNLKDGNIELHFNMDEKQYVELYIRIPDWAKNASIVIKNVKYLAVPGEYCKIAKKWKEGDIVEINFNRT